jgi:hypothetical protein
MTSLTEWPWLASRICGARQSNDAAPTRLAVRPASRLQAVAGSEGCNSEYVELATRCVCWYSSVLDET